MRVADIPAQDVGKRVAQRPLRLVVERDGERKELRVNE